MRSGAAGAGFGEAPWPHSVRNAPGCQGQVVAPLRHARLTGLCWRSQGLLEGATCKRRLLPCFIWGSCPRAVAAAVQAFCLDPRQLWDGLCLSSAPDHYGQGQVPGAALPQLLQQVDNRRQSGNAGQTTPSVLLTSTLSSGCFGKKPTSSFCLNDVSSWDSLHICLRSSERSPDGLVFSGAGGGG